MYPDLYRTLSKFDKISNEEINAVAQKAQVLHLKKNEHFVKEGQIANYVAFIRSGYLRIYFNHEGEERKVRAIFHRLILFLRHLPVLLLKSLLLK